MTTTIRRRHFAVLLLLYLSLSTCTNASEDSSGGEDSSLTHFFFACSGGKVDEVAAALKQDSNKYAHAATKDGETCLHLAAISGSNEITKLLLESGADPNVRTTFDGGLRMHPLSWNAYAGHVENIRLLLQHGADVNADVDSMSSDREVKKITALDIVEQFLRVKEGTDGGGKEADEDPANERFVKTRELLLQHGAKRYADLIASS